ncbi:Acetoin:2,6-dichlorophenolindophenol oxidoreductase subunit alpha [Anaerohalosphaera lusitana]|uniref:Acetoin:2,6-dichlorophenolindophenol oxidoreductase subunit alpha n=1 Tax=Anaerohalosphaera lusitana TaxID=1936003 RepID=A0A1U9NMW3_9BACT|nr:dehydrogenase E1 component subunit alpha/beta [Anaerohalosphaera lusitana]AQT69253.1 Acetoin:2,6-dichlorophenolindophenol oxidoreductase subunit alpha [Anaerohalosphaera lusitana]
MGFKVDDKRTAAGPTINELIKDGVISREDALDWLRTIYEIRFFEEKVFELLGQNLIKGASHLYAGEEAVATGAIAAIEKGDVIGSTHRGHGHCGAIGNKYAEDDNARQTHWNRMMAELMGRETGYCNGRGGSMHIADVKKGNLGSTGIVGGNQPPAVGAAMAEKYKKTGRVVVSFFGDGSTNTGTFHESMNMASVFDVPLVAVIENNLYGMSVPFSQSEVEGTVCASNVEDIAVRGAAYDVPAMIVDGQDVVSVFCGIREAAEYARKNSKLMMVEAKTYRWFGHSRSDPRAYRTKEEEKAWRDRDPIIVLSKRLLDEKLATQEELDKIEKAAEQCIEDATKFGLDSPWPKVEELAKDVYVAESYDQELIKAEKQQSEKAHDATAAFEKALAEGTGKSKKEIREKAQAKVKDGFGMDVLNIGQAVADAHAEEMRRDEDVVILGEDVGLYGGAYKATKGLLEEFGTDRVIDTAISEAAITGAAVGAAIRGMRPIAELMYVDFITIALDQLMHNGAFNRYMFGGHAKVPMVLRTEGGVGRCIAAHHSKSLEAWLVHVPGLYVVMPSTPYDAKGLLKASIRSDNPVVFIEHKATYGQMGAVPTDDYIIPLGVADIKRPGKDATIVTYSRQTMFALDAAKELADKHGIDAEVIDLRTVKPMDIDTVAASVRKTGRLITVSEGFCMCGTGSEITRQLINYKFEDGRCGFDYLDAPPVNLAAEDVPPPMSEPLELASIPTVDKIVASVKAQI